MSHLRVAVEVTQLTEGGNVHVVGGIGRTACGKRTKRIGHETMIAATITCESCRRALRADGTLTPEDAR